VPRGKFNEACAKHDEYALDRRQQSFVALSGRSPECARKVVGVSDVADPQLDTESTRRGFNFMHLRRCDRVREIGEDGYP
jgi:hypothetical protein